MSVTFSVKNELLVFCSIFKKILEWLPINQFALLVFLLKYAMFLYIFYITFGASYGIKCRIIVES